MVRPIRSRALALALGFALSVPLAIIGATPASAAVEDDSKPVSQMTGCGDIATPTKGGWEGPRLFVSRNATSTKYQRPTFLRLFEPCFLNSTTLGIRWQATAPQGGDWAFDGQSTSISIGGVGAFVRCYDSAGNVISRGQTTTQTARASGPAYGDYGTSPFTIAAGCSRLIDFTISIRWELDVLPTQSTPTTTNVRWTATRDLSGVPYGALTYPPEMATICAELNSSAWSTCDAFLEANTVSWGDTCGEPANAAVYGTNYPGTLTLLSGEFDFGSWLTWHGACLFYPLGGFDQNANVKTAWESSPNQAIGDQIVNLADSFTYAPGCGVLAAAPSGSPLEGFSLNTCSWTWAEPVKVILGIGVLVGGLWAFIAYVVRAVSGVIRKDVPSPVES